MRCSLHVLYGASKLSRRSDILMHRVNFQRKQTVNEEVRTTLTSDRVAIQRSQHSFLHIVDAQHVRACTYK